MRATVSELGEKRAILGAKDPSDIFIPCMIATYVATVTGIIAVSLAGVGLADRETDVAGWTR